MSLLRLYAKISNGICPFFYSHKYLSILKGVPDTYKIKVLVKSPFLLAVQDLEARIPDMLIASL